MFPFSSSPFIHTSCKGGFLKVQRKKKLLEPEALGGSCGFDQRLEQWIAQADGDRDWNQSLTIEENGWPLLFVQSWKTRSATSFSFPSCCCCLRGSCFFSSFLYRLSHCVLARRIGPAAIVQLNVYSFIIFFSFCRWWRCCFRRPRGSVVLFGGRRIAVRSNSHAGLSIDGLQDVVETDGADRRRWRATSNGRFQSLRRNCSHRQWQVQYTFYFLLLLSTRPCRVHSLISLCRQINHHPRVRIFASIPQLLCRKMLKKSDRSQQVVEAAITHVKILMAVLRALTAPAGFGGFSIRAKPAACP